jgi:hypothetical protein
MTKVFVSSTVYDLLDARAEVEALLREMHLTPVLSESSSADFRVVPDRNSIECCLANLRDCEVVVVLLSQRYGRALKFPEDPSLSATHAEYQEARKHNKKIYVYVRDRLEGEFTVHKANPQATLAFKWTEDDREGLFRLLAEHRKLMADSEHSNWISIFRDSVELKQLVRRDLHAVASRSHLEGLIHENRIPIVQVAVGVRGDTSTNPALWPIEIKFCNNGTVPALRLSYELDGGLTVESEHVPILALHETLTRTIEVPNTIQGDTQWQVVVTYYTPSGHRVRDRHSAGMTHMPGRLPFCHATLQNKTFFPSDGTVVPYDIAPNESLALPNTP